MPSKLKSSLPWENQGRKNAIESIILRTTSLSHRSTRKGEDLSPSKENEKESSTRICIKCSSNSKNALRESVKRDARAPKEFETIEKPESRNASWRNQSLKRSRRSKFFTSELTLRGNMTMWRKEGEKTRALLLSAIGNEN